MLCRETLRLAGIPDTPETVGIFAKPVITDEQKAAAMAFLTKPENAARLVAELAKVRGFEFRLFLYASISFPDFLMGAFPHEMREKWGNWNGCMGVIGCFS
jgi:hypothetical protein